MFVIGNLYVRTVPFGRVPKSCRMTGGGFSLAPVKILLAHGIWSAAGGSWPVAAVRQTRGARSINGSRLMVGWAPPGRRPSQGYALNRSDGRGEGVQAVRGNCSGGVNPV